MKLRTLGGLWIEAGEARPPADLRPRWLAVLAILAAAGNKGISRDRLLGILWSESDEERARHALSQTLYILRRELGVEPVVHGSELRLDTAVLPSDVGELNAALERRDWRRVVELYRGPFLEGFYLDAGPEFERWAEAERARLARSTAEAAEHWAREASESGDLTGAALAWRRATELDPLSTRYALSCMNALVKAGDRAGALAHARQHEAVVRRELETSPDPEVLSLADRIRRALPVPAPQPAGPAAIPSPAEPFQPASIPPSPHLVRRRRLGVRLSAAVVIVVAALLLLRPGSGASNTPVLAVGRLREAPGRDTSSSGGVLTDMLATNLGRVQGLQVVANSRLFELMRPGADTLRGAFSEAARRAGARQILEGEVSYAPSGGLQLDLRRLDLRSGVVRQGYLVRALDRYALIDSATAAVARDFALRAPGGAIAEVSTASPMAYRFYEEGLRSYYQYDAAAAVRLMRSALQEDSTFAMAAYYLWISSERVLAGSGLPYRALAMRLAPRAPERERLLILGSTLSSLESPAAVAYAESLSIRFPNDPNGQALLGGVRSTLGDFPGSARAYNRAVALDSGANAIGGEGCRACEALSSLAYNYLAWDSSEAARRTVYRWIRFQPWNASPVGVLAEIASRVGNWQEVPGLFARMDTLAPGRNDYREVQLYFLIRREDYEQLDREATRALQDPRRDLQVDAIWIWLIGLRNQGRLREAGALAHSGVLPGGGKVPAGLSPLVIANATVDFDAGRYQDAAAVYAGQAADNASNPYDGHRARGISWNLTLEGMVRAAMGDTASVRRIADSVEVIGKQSLFGRSPKLHYFLRGLLLARQNRHAEAVDAFRRAVLSLTDGFTRINSELAKSLVALGRPLEAVAVLQPALRGAVDASNLYITRTELHEQLAQAFTQAGLRDSAATHYRAVEQAWRHADPQFSERYRIAKAGAGMP